NVSKEKALRVLPSVFFYVDCECFDIHNADDGLHAVSGALGSETPLEGDRGVVSHDVGQVYQAVEYSVEWSLKHREIGPIFAMGVDEIQYARGHKYLTL